MGLFDGIKKALYNDVPDESITEQRVEKVTPLVTNVNAQQPQATQFATDSRTFGQPAPPQISEEDKKNYQQYFNALYNKAKIQCSDYGKFLADVDTIVEGDATLPEANKFRMAFNFSKKTGITKERLITSVNDAVLFVENDKIAVFDTDIKQRNVNIDNNSKLIESKKLAIQKLNEEITQLQADNEKTSNRITIKTLLYTTLAQQLVAKIKNDIAGITNYIN